MKSYKLIIIPILFFIICAILLFYQSSRGLNLDIDLKGRTQIAIDSSKPVNAESLEKILNAYNADIRIAKGISGYSILINFDSNINPDDVLNTLKENGYVFENYSVQTISPVLGESFFKQAQIALIIAFAFMAFVILVIFKSSILGLYTSLCPAFDIIETLEITQLLGIELSLASFAALLMIVGYSVDDDVMIASRVLKRADIDINQRFNAGFKTSLTTTLATIVALIALFILSLSTVITHIAIVLLIGLIIDFMNTWLFNVNLLKWHAERKGV